MCRDICICVTPIFHCTHCSLIVVSLLELLLRTFIFVMHSNSLSTLAIRNRGAPIRWQEHLNEIIYLSAMAWRSGSPSLCVMQLAYASCQFFFLFLFFHFVWAEICAKRESNEHQTKRLTNFQTKQSDPKRFWIAKKDIVRQIFRRNRKGVDEDVEWQTIIIFKRAHITHTHTHSMGLKTSHSLPSIHTAHTHTYIVLYGSELYPHIFRSEHFLFVGRKFSINYCL